ncbi:hypothetical protein TPHA_0D02920 [Tetrapisispora phaffii CBS 4417]|uniref:hydroxyacylglutathione hydrolase n=1 Tax=Tetrapisispora phaffii (strain ATCC 24235 / CBS 4417 / NBRC 1672 / NRRL Y-8282 / UCD 70-5) TaxID=1071381 RepID=G8BSV7_TETPH|nr:hypothetical protein TPHA_0D02920 [Tetrapisispora phaffii CBS 4417]CCE62928.1 hypothetical protein TPHA_0D02920 [Tetrapisispora phaffii CBS 4417]
MLVKFIKMRWATGGVNYSYLLSTADKTKSWLIDPAEPDEVLAALSDSQKRSVQAIVNTHHHYDHAGGNSKILDSLVRFSGNKIAVIGSSTECQSVTDVTENLRTYTLGSINILSIRTPCHTKDSVCYYVNDSATKEEAVFTGDTLFTAGCGRFFEGTGAEMDTALNKLLISNIGKENLTSTKVYPGHEYTKSNCKFVRSMIYKKEGDNIAFDRLEKFANSNEVTTGNFTIQDELDFNPFMRLHDPLVRNAVGDTNSTFPEAKVMEILRKLKNSM